MLLYGPQVLKLFWTLAHSSDATTDIMDQALAAHVKILDYSCTQYREQQKNRWLDKCVEELKANEKWVLPALKQIREICSLYQVLSVPCPCSPVPLTSLPGRNSRLRGSMVSAPPRLSSTAAR